MTPVAVPDEFARLYDSVPDPVALIDGGGRIAFVNARAEQVFGYERAELVGRPAEVVIPDWTRLEREIRTGNADAPPSGVTPLPARIDDRFALVTVAAFTPVAASLVAPAHVAISEHANDSPSAAPGVRAETRYLHRDGHVLWGSMTVSFIRASRQTQSLPGTPQNVGPRLPDEDEGRRDAARFRTLFEVAAAGIVEVAPDGRIVMANGAFCRMIGYTPAELAAMTAADLLYPEDRTPIIAQLGETIAGRVAAYEADRRYRRKDGSALWVRVSVRARDEGGVPSGVDAVVIDQTDRKRLEEKLRRAQKVETVGLRASGLAHDFNNLLMIISGCAGVLLDGVPNAGPTRDLVLEMTAACQRAAGLTAQLLTFSRTPHTESRTLDLNEVVAQLVRLLSRLVGPRVTLVTDLAAGPSGVATDLVQTEQVILNLAINAKDAMPQGGILTVETRGIRVPRAGADAYPDLPPGDYVQLAVSDTGVGMTDEVKTRAFEPFFTTKEIGKGTGLGLAVVQGAVTQHGGRVDVYSEPGVGTIFEILLPTAGTAPLPATGSGRLTPRGAGTVLLVEVETGMRKLARLALRAHGYSVIEAASADEAQRLATEHAGPIELLLTGTGGREVAAAMRGRHPNIKLLHLVSGESAAVLRLDTGEEATPFARKPFTPLALAYKVQTVLNDTI